MCGSGPLVAVRDGTVYSVELDTSESGDVSLVPTELCSAMPCDKEYNVHYHRVSGMLLQFRQRHGSPTVHLSVMDSDSADREWVGHPTDLSTGCDPLTCTVSHTVGSDPILSYLGCRQPGFMGPSHSGTLPLPEASTAHTFSHSLSAEVAGGVVAVGPTLHLIQTHPFWTVPRHMYLVPDPSADTPSQALVGGRWETASKPPFEAFNPVVLPYKEWLLVIGGRCHESSVHAYHTHTREWHEGGTLSVSLDRGMGTMVDARTALVVGVSKAGHGCWVDAGQRVVYTVSVGERGDGLADGVRVADTDTPVTREREVEDSDSEGESETEYREVGCDAVGVGLL
ncbi:hypothetical protein KIPB_000832 [Kipferlia bialata]|uniref:Kelch-type beta propeller n=1 Tax=Kipferlia bialata TaxID=797122 RepID=A0A391NIE3_9EUKA|nr:hypothetical protein KIPB_000832 [Kipferlia bialata]|eukprot:g832.t1